MEKSHLYDALKQLSQNSVYSVQNGRVLTDLDQYMHVKRPIEDKLRSKMKSIEAVGGGIVCLVGSAGDGKSHLISKVKKEFNWDDNSYYNDATASCSPHKDAIQTLKEALVDFKSQSIYTTNKKLVLAINLGKLNAFIDEKEVQEEYKELYDATFPIFDDIDSTPPIDSERVKVVLFTDEQIFEYYPDKDGTYPVYSDFLSKILDKIVAETDDNPFYNAYLKDKEENIDAKDPVLLNYELLKLPEVRHTLVMTIIEAIIRFRLIITPREFLDFIYSILVYSKLDDYKEKLNFYDALLPSLLYCGGDNIILKAIAKLDPLKKSNTEHDKELSLLFTSYSIPKSFFDGFTIAKLPVAMLERTNQFYDNNGKYIEETTKFLFRLKKILFYKSENEIYISYLSILKGLFSNDIHKLQEIYNLVSNAIPHHYGSYYSKTNMIPLNIQGGKYKLFANINLKPLRIETNFDKEKRNEFYLRFDMRWNIKNNIVNLRMDYQLYSYLYKLNQGKLSLSYENEKNLTFSSFVSNLTKYCDCSQDIYIVKSDSDVKTLTESDFENIEIL